MATSMRRALLMLVALLAVIGPSNRPPGRNPQKAGSSASAPDIAPCAYCQENGRRQGANAYLCHSCGRPFTYCVDCGSSYKPREKHRC
jgi:hypothetical protein